MSWWEIKGQTGPHKCNIFQTKTDKGQAYKVNCLECDSISIDININWNKNKNTNKILLMRMKLKSQACQVTKITHMRRRWGNTSERPFGIYWWTLKTPKTQNFEKIKKKCWRYHHFTQVYLCTKNHNHMRYSSWDTEWDRIFSLFLPFFALLPPPFLTTQKTKTLKK